MTNTIAAAPAIVRSPMGASIKVEPLTCTIGAELSGVSLGDASRDDALFAEIHSLLLKHKVLFFRDQDMSRAEHVAFARRFGELEDHPVVGSDPDHPGLVRIYKGPDSRNEQYENAWHCDTTWRERPQFGAVLRCTECPPVGGDMLWANMGEAYRRLPEYVKTQIADLRARHSIEASFGAAMPIEKRLALHAQFPDAEHPVVRTHPETGEKILFVNAFTTHFTNYHTPANVRFGQDANPGRRAAAQLPDQPGVRSRIPGPLPLSPEQRGGVGQPLHAALCRAGLLAGGAQPGARRHHRRQARLIVRNVQITDCHDFDHRFINAATALDEREPFIRGGQKMTDTATATASSARNHRRARLDQGRADDLHDRRRAFQREPGRRVARRRARRGNSRLATQAQGPVLP